MYISCLSMPQPARNPMGAPGTLSEPLRQAVKDVIVLFFLEISPFERPFEC